jgi:hypothetical protein
MHCTSIDACVSVNYKASGVDQGLCQLNNRTTSENLGLVSDDKFVHLSIVKRVRYFFMKLFVKRVRYFYITKGGGGAAIYNSMSYCMSNTLMNVVHACAIYS